MIYFFKGHPWGLTPERDGDTTRLRNSLRIVSRATAHLLRYRLPCMPGVSTCRCCLSYCPPMHAQARREKGNLPLQTKRCTPFFTRHCPMGSERSLTSFGMNAGWSGPSEFAQLPQPNSFFSSPQVFSAKSAVC